MLLVVAVIAGYMLLLAGLAVASPGIGFTGSLLHLVPGDWRDAAHVPAYGLLAWLAMVGFRLRGWPIRYALSYGYAPDHTTIASFISSMQNEISSIFSDILVVCEELELLGGTHFSLDGVKLSANVSKEWSGTIEELKHKRDKLKVFFCAFRTHKLWRK